MPLAKDDKLLQFNDNEIVYWISRTLVLNGYAKKYPMAEKIYKNYRGKPGLEDQVLANLMHSIRLKYGEIYTILFLEGSFLDHEGGAGLITFSEEEYEGIMYRQKRKNNPVEDILRKSLSSKTLVDLYRATPENFEFGLLSVHERYQLLLQNFNLFKDLAKPSTLPSEQKVELWMRKPKSMEPYIDFKSLSARGRNHLARAKPSFFKKYPISLAGLEPDAWLDLLKYDEAHFKPLLLENLGTISPPAQVRSIFYKKPYLIGELTPDDLERSSITIKQWLLMLNDQNVRKDKHRFNDKTLHWIEQSLSVELLAGDSKQSKNLQTALKRARGEHVPEPVKRKRRRYGGWRGWK